MGGELGLPTTSISSSIGWADSAGIGTGSRFARAEWTRVLGTLGRLWITVGVFSLKHLVDNVDTNKTG